MELYDVIIVGGGPAGLSAAMILGRCRRSVLLFDNGKQRNRMAKEMHAYLSRDGVPPKRLLQLGRKELQKYGVAFIHKEAVDARKLGDECFEVTDSSGEIYHSRMMLLATGLRDKVPDIEGLPQLYGKSVHHCPYCDGWEERDKPIAIYGRGKKGRGLALAMKTWSNDIVLCTDGHKLEQKYFDELTMFDIPVYTNKIKRLEGEDERLKRIHFTDGSSIAREAMFFNTGYDQRCNLAEKLNCEFNSRGEVKVNKLQLSSVPGLYISGDAAYEMKLAIIAAAESAKAAVGINMELAKSDRRKFKKHN